MLRHSFACALLLSASALSAEPLELALIADPKERARVVEADAPLAAVRGELADCEEGCITPSEAVAMAFAAGEGARTPGRFLLDVRSGGQSVDGELAELLFVNSMQGYARFGTLTVAFEEQALLDILRRPSACGGGLIDGQIKVEGCRTNVQFDLNMFTMMQRLNKKRLVVDGEVRLQWIDSALGSPRPTSNKRGENELGYYQVWILVEDADQVTIVFED